jgi:hypothetical protein
VIPSLLLLFLISTRANIFPGNHVAVLLKSETENQLAVAVRSNDINISKSFAEELGNIPISI